MKKNLWLAAPFLLLPALSAQAQSSEFNLICSAQAAWCNMLAVTFEKSQGVKVNMTLKGSGEAIAQIMAERANPKTDLWFGGTGDPHLQAAEQGLTLEYKSPTLPKLHDWAQKQAAQSGYKTVGIYSGPLVLATTPSCWPRRSWPCPRPGPICSSPSTRARSSRPTRPPAAPPTP
jgi:iron(III) transport system substrate-binding protein